MSLTKSELAKYMDHTLLKADATAEQIDHVAAEARELNTASVCVNGYWVPRVADALEGTDVMTCAVIGFPLSAMSTAAKAAETADVVAAGAREVDMVISIGELKAGNDDVVRADIAAVAEALTPAAPLKVIISAACSPRRRGPRKPSHRRGRRGLCEDLHRLLHRRRRRGRAPHARDRRPDFGVKARAASAPRRRRGHDRGWRQPPGRLREHRHPERARR
ncbi:MAG: deoxyribose-phosphate aldolase [Collinsella intestinalis]